MHTGFVNMVKNVKKTDNDIKEQLLVQKMGYLRLPQRVKDGYGNPKKYPNPDVKVQEVDGKLVVSYEFDLKELPKKDKGSGKDGKKG